MVKIYGMDLSTPVIKVRLAANAMDIDYDYIPINLMAGEHKKEDYLKIHPAGKVPAMNDDGFILFESNAIIKYLADKENSPLFPEDKKERAMVNQWIDFATLHIGAAIGKVMYNRLLAPRLNQAVDGQSLKDGLKFLDQFLPVVDNQLAAHKFLAGNAMTLADITLLAYLDPCEALQISLVSYPQLSAWRDGLKSQRFYLQCHKSYEDSLMALGKN